MCLKAETLAMRAWRHVRVDGHGRLHGRQQVVAGVVVQRVDDFNGVRAARDVKNGAVTEVGGELLAVQRR